MVLPVGSIINAAAIIVGTFVGMYFSRFFPDRIKTIVFQALGMITLSLGIQMFFKGVKPLPIILSLILGGIIGEALSLEERTNQLGNSLKRLIRSKDVKFTEGFVTAVMLYAIGSLVILGPLEEALTGQRTLLITKSTLDGVASIALASTYGIGVGFSSIPILVIQGGVTLGAGYLQHFFSEYMLSQMIAVGGVMVMGIGLNLLEIKKIKVISFLPALVLSILFSLVHF
ncbi:hypothetical protein AUK40_03360 [Candidatus Wirthbacteria bacterium CG2_30_54_11]|uniref:DUF554 domain-containing protein n=1 Tax=Candidatus Wirthbacteria bacterium CG2_30_54_11 TaxID=1817892 RepID=A0A1J5IYK0_9BACT|nr:MAG: hypothetical protein AUK40_03360 [Candidatus Wirthbacteria bacterium CG2_30_54_11]